VGRRGKDPGCGRSCGPHGKPLPFLSAIVACLKATLVRSAPVLIARARSAFLQLLLRFLFPTPTVAFAPIPTGLVLLQLSHILLCPKPQANTCYDLSRRGRNSFVANPALQCTAINSQESCRFGNGIRFHRKNAAWCGICQVETEPERPYSGPARAGHRVSQFPGSYLRWANVTRINVMV
jgi:hypothetical protein